ncbi:ORF1 [Giant panda anellovirus]|uniref:Capsid protein n=1 Tax=Giant panda anellovirus TaxID=2016460 RepID=A0A220IGK0_9VIRU|nr:ORF1 [Giant panda anellovirus]ASH99112.1 ORF1 [Giant panda anellovirus]
MPFRRHYRRRFRRHQFRYRRWRRPRRYWRKAWRRYRRRKPYKPVYQVQPRKRRLLVVTGWEILGIQGSRISYTVDANNKGHIEILDVAPSNKQVKYLSFMIPCSINNVCDEQWNPQGGRDDCEHTQRAKKPTYWDFVGGYGQAKFDLQSLVLRNLLGMNRFSEDIRGWTHIKFLRFKFQMVRAPELDYLFRTQMHRSPEDWELYAVHPAWLLNQPSVRWIQSIKRSKCCKMVTIKRHAPIDYSGWYDIESFRNYTLVTYQWTVFDPNNPMGKNPKYNTADNESKFWNDDWMRKSNVDRQGQPTRIGRNLNDTLDWMNRITYDNTFVNNVTNNFPGAETKKTWWDVIFSNSDERISGKQTPFLPSIITADRPNTFWFRYKFYFQLGGITIARHLQKWPIREFDDDTKTCNPSARCQYCIQKGDLDEHGILKEKAFQRITESPEHRKKKLVEYLSPGSSKRKAFQRITESPGHRKKKLVEKLSRLFRYRRKRKRVT